MIHTRQAKRYNYSQAALTNKSRAFFPSNSARHCHARFIELVFYFGKREEIKKWSCVNFFLPFFTSNRKYIQTKGAIIRQKHAN